MNKINKSLPESVNNNDVSELEYLFSQALSPIKPRDEFIHELRYRLAHNEMDSLNQGNLFQSIIFVLVGLFAGLLIIIGAIRAFLSLNQAFKLVKRRRQPQSTGGRMETTIGLNQGVSPSN